MSTGGAQSRLSRLLRSGGSRCPTQHHPLRDRAGRHHLPEGDEQLARQSLPLRRQGATIMVLRVAPRASAVRARYPGLRRGRLLRQRALLLEHQEAPRQLDHAAAHAGVAGSG